MAEFLILNDNYTDGFSSEQIRLGRKLKGSFIGCWPDGTISTAPRNPKTVALKCPDISLEQGKEYCDGWIQKIDFEVVVYNNNLDGYRIRIFGVSESVNDHGVENGRIILNKVENYLNNWNGDVVSFSQNEVIFDIGVYNISISKAFLNKEVDSSYFSDVYTKENKQHDITFNYSLAGLKKINVVNRLISMGAEIINIDDDDVTYRLFSNDIVSVFKNDLKIRIENYLYRNRYFLSSNGVDVIKNNGGLMTVTETQFNNNLIDLMVD